MPHIGTAMERSLRRSVGSYVLDSMVGPRGIGDDVNNVKTTFSSWDNCMKKVYCKWPVIVAIVIASLIVLSVLWCVIRCACCGMSCCCTCFSFLKCCDCCGGCCDGRRDAPHKHLDHHQPGPFPANQGYQPNPPMMGGGLGAKQSGYEAPQFAQFDVGKTGLAVSEDALPPMPSWETAQKKHVLSEEEKNGVELGELDPATGQKLPLMAGAAGTGISSPPTPSNEFHDGPFAAGAARPGMPGVAHGGPDDPYGQNRNAYNQSAQGYRGTPSPGPAMMGGRGYGPGQNGVDGYGPHRGGSPGPNNGFADAAVGGYGAQGQYPNDRRQFPPQPVRQYSDGSGRPVNPGRQYSNGSYQSNGTGNGYPQARSPRSPPPANNSGFDFGIGNEQPQQQPYGAPPRTYSPAPRQQPSFGGPPARSYSPAPNQGPGFGGPARSYSPAPNQQQRTGGGFSTGPPSYATRTPPPQEYQAYVPPTEPRPAAASSSAAGGRAREPEAWDPVHQ